LHVIFLTILVIDCRKWVLSKFGDNKLLLNQLFILIEMLLIFFTNSEGSAFVIVILVSCTKKNGLSIEPCETPYLIGSHLKKYFMELFFNETL